MSCPGGMMSEVAKQDPVRVVESLLREASARGASDLHVDPDSSGYRLKLRVAGQLEDWCVLRSGDAEQVVGRLKSLAQLLVYRSDLPQEGCIQSRIVEGCEEIRVSTYPALGGERVALRFQEASSRRFAELGLSLDVAAELGAMLQGRDGVVLLTGPSGSGKSTTLYACLEEIRRADPSRSLVSVEDPIERRIDGVVQTELRPQAGLDGPAALRSLVRQDPDVLMIGEIRDAETARLAFDAGLTGHLVLSTLHAGSALQVLARLRGFGLEPFVTANTLRGVLSQRIESNADGHRVLRADWTRIDEKVSRAVQQDASLDELEGLFGESTMRGSQEPSHAGAGT